MTIGYFKYFFERFFVYDNFRKKMTSALCYLIGVRVILCDFWSGVYHVGPWEGSLNRTFPVHTLLCLYVRSFLGTLYPLRAYFYGRDSFFCPEGCLVARQSKYNCLATRWPCLWNGRRIGYWMPIIICVKEWTAENFCKYVKCLKLLLWFQAFFERFFVYDNFRE